MTLFTQKSGSRTGKKYAIVKKGGKRYKFYQGGPHILAPASGGSNPGIGGTAAKPKPAAAATPAAPDPFAPQTPQQLAATAHSQAMAQLQPELDQINTQTGRNTSADTARQTALTGWGAYQTNQLNDAFTNTRNALNQLAQTQVTGGQQAQDSLAAALNAGQQGQAALGATVGGQTSAPGEEAQILQQAAMERAAGDRQSQGQLASIIGQAGADTGLAGTLHDQLSDQEHRQFLSQQQDLNDQQSQIMGRLPDLQASALATLNGQEETKANDKATLDQAKAELGETKAGRLFQQWLSTENLGLDKKKESFDEWLQHQNVNLANTAQTETTRHDKVGESIDWANVGINQENADAAMKAASGDSNKDSAKARASAISQAYGVLQSYLAQAKGENAPGNPVLQDFDSSTPGAQDKDGNTINPYVRHYDGALQALMGIPGMHRTDALRLLAASQYASWRTKARAALKTKKTVSKAIKKTAKAKTKKKIKF